MRDNVCQARETLQTIFVEVKRPIPIYTRSNKARFLFSYRRCLSIFIRNFLNYKNNVQHVTLSPFGPLLCRYFYSLCLQNPFPFYRIRGTSFSSFWYSRVFCSPWILVLFHFTLVFGYPFHKHTEYTLEFYSPAVVYATNCSKKIPRDAWEKRRRGFYTRLRNCNQYIRRKAHQPGFCISNAIAKSWFTALLVTHRASPYDERSRRKRVENSNAIVEIRRHDIARIMF